MTTPLTLLHLRFDLIARTPIKLGRERAGDRLRNALAAVMLRTVCPEMAVGRRPAPAHVATCPACWLLAAEVDPGQVRRAYSLVPPLPPLDIVAPGERFSFVLTLFGDGIGFLPYFILAVPEMGRVGVGPGRGRFDLEAVWAVDPFAPRFEPVVEPGSLVVRVPQTTVGWAQVEAAAARLRPLLADGADLPLRFLTPTRLVEGDALIKQPDFGVFFQRLLHRIDQVAGQFAGAPRRDPAEVAALHALADQVRLVDARARWVELWSWSGRTQRKSPMGGFVGHASYRAAEWADLLPWLLLGQGLQVGKLTVKGNGAFEIALAGGYWTNILGTTERAPFV